MGWETLYQKIGHHFTNILPLFVTGQVLPVPGAVQPATPRAGPHPAVADLLAQRVRINYTEGIIRISYD